MMDRVLRLREHAATVVLLVVLANIVTACIHVALRARETGLVEAMRSQGGLFMGLTSVLLVMLSVGACSLARPTTRHARTLATLGAWLVTLGTVVAAVFLVVGMFASQANAVAAALEAVGGLADLALKALAAVLLWQLASRTARSVRPVEAAPVPAVEAPTVDEPTPAPTVAPVAARDKAAGAVWTSAAEAARGAEARWGSAEAGWQPAAPPAASAAALEAGPVIPEPAQQAPTAVVAPTTTEALDGPAAKASTDLWRR